MAKKKALITGITGQDGAYLAKLLIEKEYEVFGTYRRISTPNFWRLQYLNIFDKVKLFPCDIIDSSSIYETINHIKPNEIYNLAAQSFVGSSFEQPLASAQISGMGAVRILEAMRSIVPKAKFYQASTSELYGINDYEKQNEKTPFEPSSPYSAAKLYSHHMTKIYRDGYNLFACNGILFNHESPLRGLEFVTRKITNALAKIKLGLIDKIELGNLNASRDWGYAPEYVEAMWLILQNNNPEDYVISTGETHSVKEFIIKAFEIVGLNWEEHIEQNEIFYRPLDVNRLKGNCSKAQKAINWHPKTTFNELVEVMVNEDCERWERWQKGEHFPWDAWNYPSEKKILSRKINLD
jgi:GDPmannose 4,6-dehydratase